MTYTKNMTTTKANSNAGHKRRVLATVLTLAAMHGMSDGETYAACVACGHNAIVGLSPRDPNAFNLAHMTSEANGGEYIVSNLTVLCRACNGDMGTDNLRDVLTPRYEIHNGYNGLMVSDPGKSSIISRRSEWIPPTR